MDKNQVFKDIFSHISVICLWLIMLHRPLRRTLTLIKSMSFVPTVIIILDIMVEIEAAECEIMLEPTFPLMQHG